jgi:D-serine deaminase-like pyridoxal phosphate-dependent protein
MFPELDTPGLLVDLDIMERNLREMAEAARAGAKKLRPHTKTHKSPWVAHQQLKHGASGITVAKLGEGEVMADAGIEDILIAYPIYGEAKLERLGRLMKRCREVRVSTDSVEVAEGYARLGRALGREVQAYLEVDTGLGRCGHAPGEETRGVAREIAALKGVRLIGVMTHAGHGYTADRAARERVAREEGEILVQTAHDLREKDGIEVREISTGSTPTARPGARVPGVTEIRPGTYVFNDAGQLAIETATLETCAASILVTVVGRPAADRAIVDGGSKVFTSDMRAGARTHGVVIGRPDLELFKLSEEHGWMRLTDPGRDLKIGERLRIIPNHICPCVNLQDEIYGTRGGKVAQVIPVLARGKVR